MNYLTKMMMVIARAKNRLFGIVVRISALLLLSLVCSPELRAQDPQFSQFYAAPLYINPAYTGNSDKWRAGTTYRSQWPSLDHSFETRSFYIDHFSSLISSGIGLIFNNYQESLLNFQSNEIGVSVSHALKLGDLQFIRNSRTKNDALYMRLGAQYTRVSRTANFNDLIFGDQIDLVNGEFISASGEVFDADLNVIFPSISAGVLFYIENVWLGMAVNHLNEPNQAISGQPDPLKPRLTIHGGFQLEMGAFRALTKNRRGSRVRTMYETTLTVLTNYRNQGKSEQLDLGFQVFHGPVLWGLSYRGIPIRSVDGLLNNDALIGMFGVGLTLTDSSNLTLAYSHDRTVSGLSGATGGSHEITLTLRWGEQRARNYIPPCKGGDLNWKY